ncbi:hypothetical protein CAPTEDRAFT_182233 [Capitella teleta]|uniref:Alpha-galactosidase n=1 Tax=Capitella teleta TaxID=283909 RepID=R7U5H8_CAPTE|nr:hypothetical protein CAPTEDRAFT_182233 [Capitella teleta]|eukprot:ELU01625.1 hypothetical protein CAPTEDRAFT_182233 [Capitella teleta]
MHIITVLAFITLLWDVAALDNGLALRPPMGWSSTERFGCNTNCRDYPDDCISDGLLRTMADAMQYKMKEAGYTYLSLGDCWMSKERDAQGQLTVDSKRFPYGFKALVDYVHTKGLKVGVYLSAGNASCNGFPGSLGHYETDTQTLASWGVDMVTLSSCGLKDAGDIDAAFQDFQHNLNKTGRPIVFNCEWPNALREKGRQIDYDLVSRTCNMFRTYKDIYDSWESLHDQVKFFGDNEREFVNYSKPGSWNYPDQLLVGDFGLSIGEQEMQMSVWAIMGGPLFVSADLRSISTESKNLLLNKRALVINQDSLQPVGQQVQVAGQVRIWRRSISKPKSSYAFLLLYTNISGGPSKVTIKLRDLGLTTAGQYNLTNVFTGEFLGTYKPWYYLNAEVNPVGCVFIDAVALD